MNEHELTSAVAIIGMAGRFPGARNIDEYWSNVTHGVESIQIAPKDDAHPNRVMAAGMLDDIQLFDADFFGFSPRDAEIMDPQQRFMLECAVESLEHAGYYTDNLNLRVGVYLGSAMSTYLIFNLLTRQDLIDAFGVIQISNGNDSISTPVSYKLNLTGPSMDINTTCSTSLVAVHEACRSLLGYESDMALAGGVSINVMQAEGYLYQEGSILSPDGHCRPFDAAASGTVEGSGIGLVVLKRLEDALADGDTIHAIIKSSAVNNDGSEKMGYTAPSILGQTNVIAEALEIANVSADSISYVETHGTGTALGDPIEIAALTKAFRYTTEQNGFCAIGSVKSNIGHLNTASGIAGLIKTVLALKHQMIPPSLHYKKSNPKIHFENSPFYVNTTLNNWEGSSSYPRRAGVSSFGMGGTNVHLVLEEFQPVDDKASASRDQHLLVISAKTKQGLDNATRHLCEYLDKEQGIRLADVAYTLQVGRKNYSYKKCVVAAEIKEAIQKFRGENNQFAFSAVPQTTKKQIVFMFPGQGLQYVNMAFHIYHEEPFFREMVDNCCEIVKTYLHLDLREIIFPALEKRNEAVALLNQTYITQTSLFVIEYALARWYQQIGIEPVAMIGHSLGEYVAACLAGVFSLEDALKLVAIRGKLMQAILPGKMISVNLSEKELLPYLGHDCSIAVINAAHLCVLSGNNESIDKLEQSLLLKGIEVKSLHTSHAFHSRMMDPMLNAFAESLKQIELYPPRIPYISNLTGQWITEEEAVSVDYWLKHLRHTVKFHEGIKTLLSEEVDYVFLEVGPGQALSDLVRAEINSSSLTLMSLPHPKQHVSSKLTLMETLGKLWLNGTKINWSHYYSHETRRRLPLPTYPFERKRYWIERMVQAEQNHSEHVAIRKNAIHDWFYHLSWKRSLATCSKPISAEHSITFIFSDTVQFENTKLGMQPIYVNRTRDENSCASIDYYKKILVENINDSNKRIDIIYLQNSDQEKKEGFLKDSFYSIMYLVKALVKSKLMNPIYLAVVTNQMHKVTDSEQVLPENTMFIGLTKALSQEYHHITCSNIDVTYHQVDQIMDQIQYELHHDLKDAVVAYRGHYRWVQSYEPIKIESRSDEGQSLLRHEGVYFITGGLGNLGLQLAGCLAQQYNAKLVLTSRSPFPRMNEWDAWIAEKGEEDAISKKIYKLRLINNYSDNILILQADVANLQQMNNALSMTFDHFGHVNGIVHAAGEVSESFDFIDSITTEGCEKHFRPKVHGLKVIEKLLENRRFDFCCLFSSLSSVLSGLGHAAYSSANLFMDGFVNANNGYLHHTPLISIAWDGWHHGEEKLDETISDFKQMSQLVIKPEEGCEVFLRLLTNPVTDTIYVSTTSLSDRLKRWVQLNNNDVASTQQDEEIVSLSTHRRSSLANDYVAPRDQIERNIADIWVSMLGVHEIGIHDNFFELGGHSLLATQLTSRIRQHFDVEYSLQHFFEGPTISGIAAIIVHKKAENIDESDLEQLLSEIQG
jgi:phthiocerol/phenolphthiocerol synthesis type-I polyketide synthase E